MVGMSGRGAIHATVGSRPLEPDDFSFHGFGELNKDERRKILRLGIRSDPPTVAVVDDAVFVPNGYESGGEQPKFAGGIVGPDGQSIDTAEMHRKGGKHVGGPVVPVITQPARAVDEDVVYLGMLFNHYGRVLLE